MLAAIKNVQPATSRVVFAVGLVVALPVTTFWALRAAPHWHLMWGLTFAIYASLKWLSFATSRLAERATWGRSLGYLLLWPGMNANAFFDDRQPVEKPRPREWLFAIGKVLAGLLLFGIASQIWSAHGLAAGWLGMIGFAFVLHFGLIHLVSLAWRWSGVKADRIMNFPLLASSLSDFWGKRWNTAFRDLSFAYVFRPLVGRMGVAWTTLLVFLTSGLIHDFVISLPVRAGFGRPTLYFMLQGFGLLAERSQWGRTIGLGHGVVGRLACALFVVAPLGLLFHEPFIRETIVPTLVALGAM